MVDESWREIAACKGMPISLFFPSIPIGMTGIYGQGKEVCNRCPVRPRCLQLSEEFIATGDRYGLFGGLTPTERRHKRARSRKDAQDGRCA